MKSPDERMWGNGDDDEEDEKDEDDDQDDDEDNWFRLKELFGFFIAPVIFRYYLFIVPSLG